MGGLSPVWAALIERNIELHVILTGMHQAACASHTALPNGSVAHRCGRDLGGRGDAAAAAAMGAIASDVGNVLEQVSPRALIVLGDRLDMIPAALAALPLSVPIVHLHGGEITEGAIDDVIRNAVSQLAIMHCVSTVGARTRLINMGLDERHILVTGAPGLDTLLEAPKMARKDFLNETGLSHVNGGNKSFLLVTVHPETASPEPLAPMHSVLSALDRISCSCLVTAPNSDPGGAEMAEILINWCQHRPWAVYRNTLGSLLYPNAMRLADGMLGNSSSGIVEAGLFGLPVVNVGDRQKGRETGPNVKHVASNVDAVTAALLWALDRTDRTPVTLYGEGNSGAAIAEAIIAHVESLQT